MDPTIAEFLESSVGREIAEQAEAKRVKRRQQIAAAIDTLRANREKEAPTLARTTAKAAEAVRKAEEALKSASAELSRARTAEGGAGTSFERTLGTLEGELRETADPAIAVFIEELQAAFHSARNGKLQSRSWRGPADMVTGRRKAYVDSNIQSLKDHLNGLRGAMKAAEELKLEPLSAAEVAEALDAIRAEIPGIGPLERLEAVGA